MKRPTMLVEATLRQAGMDLDLSVERDIERVRCRCKHEGLSFLTITLPTLSDALEKGLECGRFTCPTSFRRRGRLPEFLSGFFKRVFTMDGELLNDACPNVIFYIRQICRFFKKLKKGCDDFRNKIATQHFVDVEGELRLMTSQVERKDQLLDKISGIIWSQVYPEIDCLDLICHHGPGVTADKLLSNERHRIRKWNQRSEFLFPSDLHCYPNYWAAGHHGGNWKELGCDSELKHLEISEEESVRIVFVPKTQTTPRVIAIEPSHMQYMQQSVKDYVYTILETHPLTRRSIRFSHQDVNQRLAHSSSIDKRLATLDLKDASDRVHLHLVQRIFKTSGLLEYLEDARSLHATLPDGRNIVLFKYASMGSALCFPVEAMVFYTLVQSAMHQLDGRRPSSSSIKYYSTKIDIYGDDIIVPVEYADVVVNYLESYALKVNVNKSFKEGYFRESCGADFYKGIPVNPVYARMEPHDDSRRWEPDTVMSWMATADLFYMRGMWIVAETIRDMVTRVVRRTIPKARKLGSGLAFFSYLYDTDLRWNRNLHCWQQKRLHYDPVKRKDSIDGDELACLNKWGQSTRQSLRSFTSGYSPNSCSYQGYRKIPGRTGVGSTDQRGSSERRVRSGTRGADSWVRDSGLCSIPITCEDASGNFPDLPTVVDADNADCTAPGQLQPEFDFSVDYCLTEEVQADPLKHLLGDTIGLDFLTSTKRGSFKSKCRWVTLAG
uniref:RNA-directed RNA polymerase n=1 Tax=Leviviridae sp. TaxID=2027243 RepID=A0A514D8R9_9VIRU|nr:MAG: RNA-dependent RNA polymerase [Leviviridae sp.]